MRNSRASIIPTSCRDSPCWRRAIRDRQVGTGAAEPSDQPDGVSILGRRLLVHAGHVWTLYRRHGRAPRALGPRAGLFAKDGVSGRPRLWAGDAGLCLCHARLRTSGLGVRPVRVVLPPSEEDETPARLVSSGPRRLPGGLCGRDRASGRTGVGDSGLLPPGPVPARRPPARRPGTLRGRGDLFRP